MGKTVHNHTESLHFQGETVYGCCDVPGWGFSGGYRKCWPFPRSFIDATAELELTTVQDAIAAGSMKPSGMITGRIRLDEVEEKGFKTLINDKDNQVKILVEVGGDD